MVLEDKESTLLGDFNCVWKKLFISLTCELVDLDLL